MAYAHNQYFPAPNFGKSEQEQLDEQREKLGLKKGGQKRNASIQEKDEEPRYEISKIKALAENDLDRTHIENSTDEENMYGNGVILGHDIDLKIREEVLASDTKNLLAQKQL